MATAPLRLTALLLSAACLTAGCGSSARTSTHATAPAPQLTPAERAKAAELARERAAASYGRPPQSVIDAAGPTPEARNAVARSQLLRAARDLQAYHRAHGTYAIGPIASLHRLDPEIGLVDFVDGRRDDFFLAVDPPTTTTVWRYNFDHNKGARVCGPGGTGCPASRLW